MNRPSIVMIMIDALRADCAPGAAASPHLRSLGFKPPALESLNGLVDGAYTFTQAIACAPYTTTCTASILTGLLPPEHGVRSFSTTSLSSDVRTLAAILGAAGYATCAMSDRPQVLQPMGLLKDFQTITPTDEEALAWWDSYAAMPRFLFLHLWDAHKPYAMPVARAYRAAYPAIIKQWQDKLRTRGLPPPPRGDALDDDEERQLVYQMQYAWEDALGVKAGLETYIEGLRLFDHGRLRDLSAAFSARHMLDESISVILADHGEGRDRPPSQRLCHGSTLFDDQLRVPLYVRLPGAERGRTIDQQVSEADVAPTILDALGLLGERTQPSTAYSGRSLLPLMQGQTLAERSTYAEFWTLTHTPAAGDPTFHPDVSSILRFRMLRDPQRKFFLAGQPFAASDLDGLAHTAVVEHIARRLLGRLEQPEDGAAWLPLLQNGTAPEKDRRQTLLRLVENSYEYKHLHKHAVYNLHDDPLEVKPLDPRRSTAEWEVYRQQIDIMAAIDRGARAGEPLLTNEADEQIILKRLQDLGYVE
jgi:arylsulfatase A-like enzyme